MRQQIPSSCIITQGCGDTGDKVELRGTQAMICYETRMVPICGRSFWTNNNGVQLFCKMLGKSGGKVDKSKSVLQEDAFVVGKCSKEDSHLSNCTSLCNKRTLGGDCEGWDASCYKRSNSGMKVHCFGKLTQF